MKKTILASAVLAAAISTAQADTIVYGALEQQIRMSDSATDLVGEDQYIGIKSVEDLGNGVSAFANISLDVDAEGANASTTRDAYVGLKSALGTVQAGRMQTPNDHIADASVDIFEGPSLGVVGDGRASSAVSLGTEFGPVSLGAVSIHDAGGDDGSDLYSVAAGMNVGPVAVNGSYTKDRVTNDDAVVVAGAGILGPVAVGGTYQIINSDDVVYSVVGSLSAGKTAFKGGYENSDIDGTTYIGEAAYSFSKKTTAFVNYSDSDAEAHPVYTAGLRVEF